MRKRAALLLLGFSAGWPSATGCGGTACPDGWDATAEDRCEPTAETIERYEGRVGTGFFGYAAYGERVSDDDEPCEWEPTELAPREGFDVRVTNEAGEELDVVRVHVEEDGIWELVVVPGRTYDLLIESSLDGEPVLVQEGDLKHVAVFFDTGC